MTKLVKLAASAGLSAVSLSLMATSAFAGTNTVFNTGDCFHFNSGTATNTHISVTNNNEAFVNQMAFSMANTGFNQSNRNILGGGIHTGNANVSNYFSVNANSNWTNINVH